ncbi:GlxA family transcriptional regulator [Pseudomonas typographi]|uniref:Helix-turn-helix domain-containing protein n=1 Tax=Pseudomonas typographi TaxID=2715964 RepID=A0ABR7Z2I7_9PSED|nr:helix-turn-helix domain-containing protein [Pseudomonas typographi]MBD1550304.1 helix-turn-helix domain-containing protein [Pseudomonas typographi]MBD1585930.1 helix-turn-helix domain-containing protein [Pseudomonas typographi]MBD1599704.1 helix-turn-helix domain-containing protein [Pseudomonas typographi]
MLYKRLIHRVIPSELVTLGANIEAGVRPVVILAYTGCFVGDVVKLLEALGSVNERATAHGRKGIYVAQVYSLEGGVLMSPSTPFLTVETRAICSYKPIDIDMLMIAHGSRDAVAELPHSTLDWLQKISPRARRILALGAGVFWLAAAGLLNNRRVTTHSALAGALRSRFPAVHVEPGRRLQIDGPFHTTSECIDTGDMARLMLREESAGAVFDTLQSHRHRPASQPSDLTAFSVAVMRADSTVYRACVWWLRHLDQDLSMALSARSLGMSERNFRRHFKLETGYPPYYFLLLLRLEMARQALVDSSLPVDKVARRGGLRDGQQLARIFRKYIGLSPQQYRANMRAGYIPLSHPDYARLFNAKVQPPWLEKLMADVHRTLSGGSEPGFER